MTRQRIGTKHVPGSRFRWIKKGNGHYVLEGADRQGGDISVLNAYSRMYGDKTWSVHGLGRSVPNHYPSLRKAKAAVEHIAELFAQGRDPDQEHDEMAARIKARMESKK